MERRDWLRILDANGNRVREALRVVEDTLRLGTPARPALAATTRALRHRAGGLAVALGVEPGALVAARDVRSDPGAAAAPFDPDAPGDALTRNLARATEALRSMEEAARSLGLDPAPAAALRFDCYALESGLAGPAGDRLAALHLCVLLDPAATERPLPELAALVAGAGPVLLQVRCKGLEDAALLALVRDVVAAATPFGAPVIVNDRADIAVAAGAAGVHVGAGDLPVAAARAVVGPDRWVGATAHDPAEAAAAEAAGADYLGYGTVFASALKPTRPPCGPAAAAAAARARGVPVYAIGGIGLDTIAACRAAGVTHVAVASAVGRAGDPGAVVRRLGAALQS